MTQHPGTNNAGAGDSPQNSPQGVSSTGVWLGRESNPRHADFQTIRSDDASRHETTRNGANLDGIRRETTRTDAEAPEATPQDSPQPAPAPRLGFARRSDRVTKEFLAGWLTEGGSR